MHHFFEAITNTAGDSLIGYFARVINRTTQNTVALSSDENGTPIVVVSGVENMAKTDDYGNLSLYVEPGTYHLDIYAPNTTTFLYRVSDVAMNSTKGDPGKLGETGDVGASDATFSTLAALKAINPATYPSPRLAAPSGASGGYVNGPFTYQTGNFTGRTDVVVLDTVPITTGALVRNSGSALLYDSAQTVNGKLDKLSYVTDARFAGGAKGDGVYTASSDTVTGTDDTAAINAALAAGGRVVFPGPNRIYRITDRLLATVPGTWIELEAGVQIIGMPWRYPGGQTPFGSLLLITADNCTVSGASKYSSGFRVLSPSEANGVTFLHCGNATARNFFVKHKAGSGAPISDDTFETGFHILNATGGSVTGTLSNALVENIYSEGFSQYGFQFYGDLSGGIMRGCTARLTGILTDPTSRGSGIAITRGVRNLLVADNDLSENKEYGVLLSSAGLDSYNITFNKNRFVANGRGGISGTEETNLASVAGQGMDRITITENRFIGNGKNTSFTSGQAAIRMGTYDNVGYIKNYECSRNFFEDNVGYNELYQGNTGGHLFDGGKSLGNVSKVGTDTVKCLSVGTGVANVTHANFYDGDTTKHITDNRNYWTTFSFTAGWGISLGSPFEPSGYMIEPSGHVALRINTQGGSNGEVAYTMPVGLRPKTIVVFSDAANRGYVTAAGEIIFASGSGPFILTIRYLPYA